MHILTVGNSYTGKTNLNKRFALSALQRDQNVIVFDPLQGTGWPGGSVKFSSAELFLQHVEKAETSHVFVDEAKVLWDHDYKRADRLLYSRRHQGLLVYLIAQRTRMVPPNARNQCSKVFAFRQQKMDADILTDEYHEALTRTRSLEVGQFIYTDGFYAMAGRLVYECEGPPSLDLVQLDKPAE